MPTTGRQRPGSLLPPEPDTSKSAPVKRIVIHRDSVGTRGQIFGQKMRPTGNPNLVNFIVTRNRIVMFYLCKPNSKESPYTGALQNALSFAARGTLEELEVNMVATMRRSEREDEPIVHQLKKSKIEHKSFLLSIPKENEADIKEIAKSHAANIAKVCERYSMQDQWSAKFVVGEDLTPKKLRPVAAYVMNAYCAAILVDVYDRISISDLLQNEALIKKFFGRHNFEAGREILEESVNLLPGGEALASDGSVSDEYASDDDEFFRRQKADRATEEDTASVAARAGEADGGSSPSAGGGDAMPKGGDRHDSSADDSDASD